MGDDSSCLICSGLSLEKESYSFCRIPQVMLKTTKFSRPVPKKLYPLQYTFTENYLRGATRQLEPSLRTIGTKS
nr:hypothetical protein CFP56_58447 [Quercus suber]